MKALSASVIVIALMASGTAAVAKDQTNKGREGLTQLSRSLGVVASAAKIPTSQTPKTIDNDQGDDHANPRAIERVCSKDTPAAQRSAICPISVSPE